MKSTIEIKLFLMRIEAKLRKKENEEDKKKKKIHLNRTR